MAGVRKQILLAVAEILCALIPLPWEMAVGEAGYNEGGTKNSDAQQRDGNGRETCGEHLQTCAGLANKNCSTR